jgi:hypothetical protein
MPACLTLNLLMLFPDVTSPPLRKLTDLCGCRSRRRRLNTTPHVATALWEEVACSTIPCADVETTKILCRYECVGMC